MNNKYGLIGVIMTVLIGIILVGSVLAPTIQDIQKTAGDEVTYTNGDGGLTLSYYEEDFTMTVTDTSVTINDYEIDRITSGTPRIVMWEYGRLLYYNTSNSNICRVEEQSLPYTATFSSAVTLTYDYSESLLTVTDGTTTQEITASNVLAIAEDGDYVLVNSTSYASRYYNTDAAENGTLGYLQGAVTIDGTSYPINVNKSGVDVYGLTDYSAKMTITGGSIVDGTTDIYSGGTPTAVITYEGTEYTVSVFSIGSAILKDIDGHLASGTEYTLYGVVIVLFVVFLFAVAMTSIMRRGEN